MFQLRPYQQQVVDGVHAAWNSGLRNVLAVLPTGGGKTVCFADILSKHRGAACAIAHRQELVTQISLALARDEVYHRVIGPDKVVRLCSSIHVQEVGRSFINPSAMIGVAGVDTLVRRGESLAHWLNSVTLWVQDECFIAGTLVDGKPIETIQLGDEVRAFNENTGCFEKRKVTRFFKNPSPSNLYKITTWCGRTVFCTEGHPIWTKEGWKNAGEITETDELLVLRERDQENYRVPEIPVEEIRKDILLQKMWDGFQTRTPEKTSCNERNGLSCVREDICGHRGEGEQICDYGAALLQQDMLEQVPLGAIFEDNGENQQKVCIGANEKEQPDASTRMSGENGGDPQTHWARSEDKGWQRNACNGGRSCTAGDVPGVRIPESTYSPNRPRRSGDGLSGPLQDRLWLEPVKDSDRSGRGQPLLPETERTGCKEGKVSYWSRVESVEVFESDDLRDSGDSKHDGFVYNIEVEGLHTYVANNIVVHNCHHVLTSNKWGKAASMFPNAKGLGVTATPLRADGAGLGVDFDGLFETMVIGPSMRDLINDGFLTEYRIFAPSSDLDLSQVNVTASGDYSGKKLKIAVEKSHIIGDVVEHYQRIAAGKLGVTFATDVETSNRIAGEFNAAGIPAEAVSAKTPDRDRIEIIKRFRDRELLQLVNCDLFGEGFDLPAIEVVSMARPTQSYGLYVQQFGRALRLMEGKDKAIIIDHVGNVMRHGLPDTPKQWSLARRDKSSRAKGAEGEEAVKSCPECTGVYPRVYPVCPYCGHKPVPSARTAPEFVDGDLHELDEATLAAMRGEVAKVDQTVEDYGAQLAAQGCPTVGRLANMKRHGARQEAQKSLRESIAYWAGYQRSLGRPDSESFRRFYLTFGVDVLTAQALKTAEARELNVRVDEKIAEVLV